MKKTDRIDPGRASTYEPPCIRNVEIDAGGVFCSSNGTAQTEQFVKGEDYLLF